MSAPTVETVRVTLGATFYDDHCDRDLFAGTVVGRVGSKVVVDLASWDYDELMSDASHYAFSMAEGGYEDRAVIGSAKRVVAALRKVERPEGPTASEVERAVQAFDDAERAEREAHPTPFVILVKLPQDDRSRQATDYPTTAITEVVEAADASDALAHFAEGHRLSGGVESIFGCHLSFPDGLVLWARPADVCGCGEPAGVGELCGRCLVAVTYHATPDQFEAAMA